MRLIYVGWEDGGSTNRDRYEGGNVWAQGTRGHTVGLSMFKLSLNIDLNGYMVIIFNV